MGLESAPQRGIQIEPRSLIAAADPNVVTPTAVEALTDAFRKGAITVDDISARRDQSEQRKMQLAQMQQEAAFNSDPQIIEAKRAAAIAHGSVAKAAAARADSDLKLAPLAEQLDRASKVKAIFENEALTPIEQTTTAFGLLGLSVPKRADGTIDVEATRPTRAAYDEYVRKLQRLSALTAPHSTEKREMTTADGGSVTTSVQLNALGDPIDNKDVAERDRLQQLGFQGYLVQRNAPAPAPAPVTPAAAPVEIIQLSPEEAAKQRARLVNAGQLDPAAGLSDAEVSALVQPKASAPKVDLFPVTPGTPALGQSMSGQPGRVTSIKEAPPKALTEKTPTEAQQRALLALPRFAEANTALQDLQRKNYDPTTWKSWVSGMMPEILKSGNRKEYETAIAAWSQGLLRLESGAAISLKEQVGYEKAFFPQVGDPAHVVQQKESLRHAVEETVAQVGAAGNIAPEISARADALFKQALVNAGGKAIAEPAAQQVNIPGLGVGTYRNGKFYPGAK